MACDQILESSTMTKMNRRTFWTLIDRSRRHTAGDSRQQEKKLRKLLTTLSPAEIVRFDHIFYRMMDRAYDWDLWGASAVVAGGSSDDRFIDFREWLISRGQRVFEAALKDPNTLSRIISLDDKERSWKSFQNPAMFIWAEKTQRDWSEFPRPEGRFREFPRGKELLDTTDHLKVRYPKLWKKYGPTRLPSESEVEEQRRKIKQIVLCRVPRRPQR